MSSIKPQFPHRVGAGRDEFLADRLRHAKAAGGVFAVDDQQVDLVGFQHMR